MDSTVDTYGALFWAYTSIWIIIFCYLLLISREQTKLKNKIEQEIK